MRTKWFVLSIALLISATLSGCGSSGGSGGDSTTGGSNPVDPVTGISYATSAECVNCHQGFSWSEELVAEYLSSKHVIHSTYITAASDASCLECHDPIGEQDLGAFIDPANVPADGLAAVGCENCHGPGGEHFGVGPVPNFNPDYDVCGKCHNALPDSHLPHHPLADNILDNYKLSNHYVGTADGEARGSGVCKRCHSDEGFTLFIDETIRMGDAELDAFLDGTPDVDEEPIQCRTCHNPHTGELRTAAFEDNDWSDGTDIVIDGVRTTVQIFSAQFQLCTSCHIAILDWSFDEATETLDYTLIAADDESGWSHHTDGPLDEDSRGRDIYDTHFEYRDPADYNSIIIDGYNINAAAENACTNCHDPHAGSKFDDVDLGFDPGTVQGITEEWANTTGFHGDYQGPGFEHGCAPCHSPEGLIELTAGGGYEEPETEVGVIACVACHDLQTRNATNDGFELGELRPSPEFAFDNARTEYAAALEADPETMDVLATTEGLEENALCMTCHSGRESTASVNATIAASSGPYRFKNIHYLAAGATLFGNQAKGVYEYDGKTYSSKFEHVASNDLCVECHNVHSGELFLTDPGFGPTGCDNCHTGVADTGDYENDVLAVRDIRLNGSFNIDYDGDGNDTEGIYYEIQTLIDLLEAELAANGAGYFPDHYPYFWPVGTTDFSDRDNASQLTATLLKAAYNLQVAKKDPGSYAHNGTYIIEILYDSLEDLGYANINDLTRDAEGHFDAAGEPFRHWDEDGEMSTRCARCHSSEGAIAFIENGTVTEADFSEYSKGFAAGLACEVCHVAPFAPATAAVTRGDAITSVTFPSGDVINATNAAVFFADDSPLCMNCHQGRESGLSVDGATPDADTGEYRFVNIHYFAAASSLFGSDVNAGYEYGGKTYDSLNTFPSHGGGLNTCAACHLGEMPDHTFKPAVSSCTGCHGGTSFETLGFKPGTNRTAIELLKDQLEAELLLLGVTYDADNYPYFDNIFTLQQLRAAYNMQVATKDPAGFIHNGDYIRQILFDSIEDLGATPDASRSVAAP